MFSSVSLHHNLSFTGPGTFANYSISDGDKKYLVYSKVLLHVWQMDE